MDNLKMLAALVLVFAFSFIVQGQEDFEDNRIDTALGSLRTASLTSQEAGPGAELQRNVRKFLATSEVENKNYKSDAFGSAVESLRTEAAKIGKEGPLVKAVLTLATENQAYRKENGLSPKTPATPEATPKATTGELTSDLDNEPGLISTLTASILPFLKVITVLLILAMLLYTVAGLQKLRRTTNDFVDSLPNAIGGLKSRQDAVSKQFDGIGASNNDLNQRLADVQTEIRQMTRMLQQSALANNRQLAPSATYMEPATPLSDLPAFPIAAEELLRQMHGKSVIVKRDFQNDMLVSDPDGKGELVLLRDSQLADENQPLFIVPSVTQFQMRQEYYNFYAKYYDCSRPESGAVWIIDPAVVEKVSGGWQLREKGILEVR